jgi:PleD family two-component response regulator
MSATQAKVLIADPDPDVNRTLANYFERHQYKTLCVEQSTTVLSEARKWQPNAIMISARFKDSDPYQLCEAILGDTLTAHIPTIMILHLNDRKSRMDALEAGADDVVSQPIDLEELRLRIESAIRLSTLRIRT